MKTLLTISTLVFTILLPPPSHAEWTKLGKNVHGNTLYVDFGRIRKVDGYVYYWWLGDYLKPSEVGDWSAKVYHQGDCKLFRYKGLSWSFHKEPMAGGTGQINNDPDKNWKYPSPGSSVEVILKLVCKYAERLP